jgi:DNA-binding LacI/PurR family transcriptional regulator
MKRTPDSSELRELAVHAGVDPRTVAKALRGEPVRGMAYRRAAAALRQAGYDVPEQPTQEEA